MEIKIKKLHPQAIIPEYKTAGAAGFDFSLIEDITIPARSTAKVPTGLVIAVPENYVLLVFSRSSGPLKTGTTMANGAGVLDSDYCGPNDEIFCLVENITDSPITLTVGQRVAQGIIVPVIQAKFIEGEMTAPDRGGLGSTGK